MSILMGLLPNQPAPMWTLVPQFPSVQSTRRYHPIRQGLQQSNFNAAGWEQPVSEQICAHLRAAQSRQMEHRLALWCKSWTTTQSSTAVAGNKSPVRQSTFGSTYPKLEVQ